MNTAAPAKIECMSNHPNRSKKSPTAAANPTPAEILRARTEAGLTQTQAAELVHSPLRSWQSWEDEPGTENHRRMHPSTWELFQIKVAARRQLKAGEVGLQQLYKLGISLPVEG